MNRLPPLIAGPIVRRLTPQDFTLWLVTSQPLAIRLRLQNHKQNRFQIEREIDADQGLQIGKACYFYLIHIEPDQPIPENTDFNYSLKFQIGKTWTDLLELQPSLAYPNQSHFTLRLTKTVTELLHGSCRKPHYQGPDALVAADQLLAQRITKQESTPDFLLLSGDQVYVDDLCGPMLYAVHRAIALLGLPLEAFPEGKVTDSEALYSHPKTIYGRRELLPELLAENRLSRLFTGAKQPIFTSAYCDNHLISFGEVLALYLLSWSPVLWEHITLPRAYDMDLPPSQKELWRVEKRTLESFIQGLPQVQRLFAHIPTYMIFDDHDVTDDWNLNRGWEEAAYGHPFSRRMIGNALMAYWLCQGWGNNPRVFNSDFWNHVTPFLQSPNSETQDAWISHLLNWENWHYNLPTTPPVVVLDTRTRRWRSESDPNQPSGLMDWEALMEFQQAILKKDAVVVVSPAPMFGVKLVEILQWMLTSIGKALAVDAENWMAHPGAANTLLHIFTNRRTPRHFVILSGDVHYSFVYDIVIRFRRNSPKIWQITCSGLKNEFPHNLLKRLGQLNRGMFHRKSPLNWLTRRKRLKIEARRANGRLSWQLVNQSSIGLVRLNAEGAPHDIRLLTGHGEEIVFLPDKDSPIGPVNK